VTGLPPFQLGHLASPLLTVDLDQFTRDFQLLPLHLEHLPLGIEGLTLQIGQEVEQKDWVVRVCDR
jgi:hypothetical protein